MSVIDPKDLIRAGRLSEARKQLIEEIKASPADLGKRTILFQVLSFLGEWDKAERHLDAIVIQNPHSETGIQVYKNLIHAEKERTEVLKFKRRPSFLPNTPSYTELYFTACENLIKERIEEASEIFDQIETQRPLISGTLDGTVFYGFKDLDIFLSFFLEAIIHERYVWIPFESIRELSIPPPKSLFDLLWITGRVTTWEGLTITCYLPVLYPGSYLNEDDRVKLGRMTDWTSIGGLFSKGSGQHVFQIGEKEIAMLEIREIMFKIPDTGEKDEKTD